jgi:hypothetical protein
VSVFTGGKKGVARLYILVFAFGSPLCCAYDDSDTGTMQQEVASVLTVQMPPAGGRSQLPFIQPVHVRFLDTGAEHRLSELTVTVSSNPAGHQKAFSARFTPDFNVTRVRTYIRLAGRGEAMVEASAKTLSGRITTANTSIRLGKGVDFDDESTLTRRLEPNVKGLHGPVGTARARLWIESERQRRISAIVQHPMLPESSRGADGRLVSLYISYRGTLLADVVFGDAMSNDPYFDITFEDTESGSSPIRIRWTEEDGTGYEPVSISVK